eukprot:9522380-Lingulodinium_polyedra.AAC.1
MRPGGTLGSVRGVGWARGGPPILPGRAALGENKRRTRGNCARARCRRAKQRTGQRAARTQAC